MFSNHVWKQLELKGESILGKWSQLIVDTYSVDTATFLNSEKDRFINPVGYIISQETRVIYDELVHDMNLEKLTSSLSEIIKIRSVQEFTPAEAIGFIFLLKQATREELANEIVGDDNYKELLGFESRIDRLALLAFDIYLNCKEKINEIRVKEVVAQREATMRILARTNVAGGSE
jgi:hypothetical protein